MITALAVSTVWFFAVTSSAFVSFQPEDLLNPLLMASLMANPLAMQSLLMDPTALAALSLASAGGAGAANMLPSGSAKKSKQSHNNQSWARRSVRKHPFTRLCSHSYSCIVLTLPRILPRSCFVYASRNVTYFGSAIIYWIPQYSLGTSFSVVRVVPMRHVISLHPVLFISEPRSLRALSYPITVITVALSD